MLTYELKKRPGVPLYEALYRCIRQDILTGKLQPGEKLPSKRALSQHLEVGKITVETAYAQLLSEGYIRSREKVGFFVEKVEQLPPAPPPVLPKAVPEEAPMLDLTANGTGHFPFSVWSKLQREVILDYGRQLLLPLPNQGIPELRQAIAAHLAAFRGMEIDPENILVGAGTDFLYNLLIQLLGRDKIFAVEEPGYEKIRRVYTAGGVRCISAPMDAEGVMPQALMDAQVLHISPSHHFPTGLVTPLSRRQALLNWASSGSWIIEDDYDSEFRFASHPLPAMQSMSPERVIYINSFSKSLAPSIRISYMVLPPALMEKFRRELGFYSCTVPSFEQYTLARFLSDGYFEKHINRLRNYYQTKRDAILQVFQKEPLGKYVTIREEGAGVHFLMQIHTEKSEEEIVTEAKGKGIKLAPLSHYFDGEKDGNFENTYVINYSSVDLTNIEKAAQILYRLL